MRPLYETLSDRQRERYVLDVLAAEWNCQAFQEKRLARIDGCLTRDKSVVAFAEIKCRNNNFDLYSTLMIDFDKWLDARVMARETGLPVFLAVWYSDCIAWTRFDQVPHNCLGVGGRSDRGDPQDRETVIYINLERFKVLKWIPRAELPAPVRRAGAQA